VKAKKAFLVVVGMCAIVAAIPVFASGGHEKVIGDNAPAPERSVTTVLTSSAKGDVRVSIALQENRAALASWLPDSGDKVDSIAVHRVAKIQAFVKLEASERQDGRASLVEIVEFPEDDPLVITIDLPQKNQTIWLKPAVGPWVALSYLQDHPDPAYAFKLNTDKDPHLVLSITKWPAGDPTLGWGSRPPN
jgi:hypothetical protein